MASPIFLGQNIEESDTFGSKQAEIVDIIKLILLGPLEVIPSGYFSADVPALGSGTQARYLRACLYEAGWPVSELAHLQVKFCYLVTTL